jgi:cyclopropane-fatty-acyl-phospholipid synthase
VGERVEFRVADYRELAEGGFDAIASIGMVEHVGEEQIDNYAKRLAELLRPGGRLLNHGIARLRHSDAEAGPFSERFVFPDAEPVHLSRILLALERAGFETGRVEGFRADYAETLRHWAGRLDQNLERARQLAGPERVRVWRLYLRAARNGFLSGFTSIYQVEAALPADRRSLTPGLGAAHRIDATDQEEETNGDRARAGHGPGEPGGVRPGEREAGRRR